MATLYYNSRGKFFLQPVIYWLRENKESDIEEIQIIFQGIRSRKRHIRQPVRNQTFIDRSIIKWVQYACVSTMKFKSSFSKLFTINIYGVPFIQFWFQIKFTPMTGELFIL